MRLTVGDQGFLGAFEEVDTDRIEVVVLAILALSFRKSRPPRTMLLIVANHTVFGEREVNQLYVVRPSILSWTTSTNLLLVMHVADPNTNCLYL